MGGTEGCTTHGPTAGAPLRPSATLKMAARPGRHSQAGLHAPQCACATPPLPFHLPSVRATPKMAPAPPAHARCPPPLPRWRRGSDGTELRESSSSSGCPVERGLGSLRHHDPERGGFGPQEGDRGQTQAGGAGPGGLRRGLGEGPGPQPPRVAVEMGPGPPPPPPHPLPSGPGGAPCPTGLLGGAGGCGGVGAGGCGVAALLIWGGGCVV